MDIISREEMEEVDVFGIGEPNTEYSQYLVGNSYLKTLSNSEEAGVKVRNVTFEPGCRNYWHIHHAKSGGGQVLICTAGEGWYQEMGKQPVSLTKGSVITVPANVKNWHGAKKDTWFSHIAVELPGEETSTEWLQKVNDAWYNRLGKEGEFMGKVKIFIAQPMRHKSDEEIIEERVEITNKLKNELFAGEDVEILNSYMEDFTASHLKNKSLNYLGKSIQLLSEADYVFFAKGWKEARGCHIEHECAERYGINIIED